MVISFKGTFSVAFKDAADTTNRGLKQGLDTNGLCNLAEFKKYTPDSFKLEMNNHSRPYYDPNMEYRELEKYNSSVKKYEKETGRLMIVNTKSGDKFIVSERVTNSDDTINTEKFQTALNALTLEKIKNLSEDFSNIIKGCEDKVKKESSQEALDKIFSSF